MLPHRKAPRFWTPLLLWCAAALRVSALDYSAPYLRDGLPYFGAEGVAGWGAIVGELEVRGAEGNGIDGFDGHRQTGLGPDPGDLEYGLYGFQDVKDFSGANNPADDYFHGTFVAGVMASEYVSVSDGVTTKSFLGVAPLARYYGAVFDGADSKAGFLSLKNSLDYLAITAQASVINNSWGSEPESAAQLDGSTFGTSLLMDEYAGYFGKTDGTTGVYLDKLMVISAGNSGDTTGLLGAPGDSYNGLTVGALDVVDPDAGGLFDAGRTPAPRIAPYSSWRPLADGRAGVDVVAPGTNLWSTLAINYAHENGLIAGYASGTSFAAPHVAGEAALLYGAQQTLGYVSDKGTFLSTDHKLVKALIINSATKIPGLDAEGNAQTSWQSGVVVVDAGDVPNAIVPLNYAVGAGSANANEAYQEFREAGDRFWDLGVLVHSGDVFYYTFGIGKFVSPSLDQPFLFSLTATLTWDRHVDFVINADAGDDALGEVTKDLLSNLDLILQREVTPGAWTDVYRSAGAGDNVEHIYQPQLSGVDRYRLEVRATSIAEPDLGEEYALVVSYTTVPEPGGGFLLVIGLFSLGVRRRRA